MKWTLNLLLLLALAVLALATTSQKQIMVSYPKDTPSSVVEEAMDAIRKAGGAIEHEFTLIKGFAAKAPAKVLETVQALGSSNNVLIEEDLTVHTNGS